MMQQNFLDATDEELLTIANGCLNQAGSAASGPSPVKADLTKLRLFLEAQLCLSEVIRKRADQAAQRDRDRENRHFWIEIIVVAVLIAGELAVSIYYGRLGVREGKEQAVILDQMNKNTEAEKEILDKLNTSSGATAGSLVSVKDSLNAMKLSLEKQVEAFYDVQLNVIYNEPSRKLILINDGRARVELWALRVGGDEQTKMTTYDKPVIITPTGAFEFSLDEALKQVATEVPKGHERWFSTRFLLKNQKGERFTLTGALIGTWNGDTPIFKAQIHAILPGWKEH